MRRLYPFLAAGMHVAVCCLAQADNGSERTRLLHEFMDEFIDIAPGEGRYPITLRMGSSEGPEEERPVHRVRMIGPFAMAKYEVPQNLYQAVMGSNPSRWKGSRNSVEMVTYYQAEEFCRKITHQLRLEGLLEVDQYIRLPTEAEWEYCCRAGTVTNYTFGDQAQAERDWGLQASRLDTYAWHAGNAAGNDPAVGSLAPNAWGLYDMHGYLWEYCLDGWHENYACAPGESFPAWTSHDQWCVLRGGSWKDRYDRHRSSARRKAPRSIRDDAIGFRCVRTTTNISSRGR